MADMRKPKDLPTPDDTPIAFMQEMIEEINQMEESVFSYSDDARLIRAALRCCALKRPVAVSMPILVYEKKGGRAGLMRSYVVRLLAAYLCHPGLDLDMVRICAQCGNLFYALKTKQDTCSTRCGRQARAKSSSF
jgi:hypothetical protein